MSSVATPPRTATPPPRRRWPWGLVVLLVVLVVAAVLVVGSSVVAALGGRSHETSRSRIEEPVRAIDVEVDAGSVVVEPATGAAVEVVATRRWAVFGRPDVREDVVDGALRVRGDCPGWLPSSCGVDLRLAVPEGVTVTASTKAGPVQVTGLEADVEARSAAGPVTVADVTGDVRVSSSAGPVRATGLDAERIEASSSAGSVVVEAERAPSRVVATTSAGGVEVVVPPGSYDVDASSTVGRVDVDVVSDPSSPRRITARSSAGGVRVRER